MLLMSPFTVIPAVIIIVGVCFAFYYVFKLGPEDLSENAKKASMILIGLWVLNLVFAVFKIFPDKTNPYPVRSGLVEIGFVTVVLILAHTVIKLFSSTGTSSQDKSEYRVVDEAAELLNRSEEPQSKIVYGPELTLVGEVADGPVIKPVKQLTEEEYMKERITPLDAIQSLKAASKE